MAIDFEDTSASLDTAMVVAKDFRISKEKAIKTVKDIVTAVKQWKKVADNFGLSKCEIDRMASAFEHKDLRKAEKF